MASALLKRTAVLSAGKAQWEKAFDAAAEVFVLHDPAGRIFRANLALARLANLPLRECVGRRCADLLPGLCTPFDAAQRIWRDPVSGRRFSVTTQWINLEGQQAALHVLRDVTEEQRVQALEAEHRQMEFTRNLLQGVAHEIRNPIFAVQTLLQAMALREIGGKEAAPFTEKALAEVQRLDAVVRRFLQLAFLEDGTEAERAPLEDLAEEAWRETARGLEEKPLPYLSLSPEVRRTFVRVHRRSFVPALTELFANAAAYSPPGATVHLSAVWEDPRHLRIEIRDLGPGVEAATAERIFEPFFTTRPQKTGLGLTLARAAVEREGGSLSLGVCPPGSPGALFLVRLPAEEEETGEKGP
jgi:two-component system sensor histidine kinase FlrB